MLNTRRISLISPGPDLEESGPSARPSLSSDLYIFHFHPRFPLNNLYKSYRKIVCKTILML